MISVFIGNPTIFIYYVGWMAVALAAAIFARQPTFRFAISIIILSWFLSRFWRMTFPGDGLGFLVIDLILVAAFLIRWRAKHDIFAKHLAIIHAGFVVLHFLSITVDLSAEFWSAMRTHEWMYSMWRNRIFEVSLAYIIFLSSIRVAVMRSKVAARIAEKVARLTLRLHAFVPTRNTFLIGMRKNISSQ